MSGGRRARARKEPRPDISVVLNVHNEAAYLKRTMLSLEEAADYAVSQGLKLELVVVQDRPDARTSSWFASHAFRAFDSHQLITVDNGSLGLSRNDGLRAAKADYIATADADDLVSFNMFAALYDKAVEVGRDALIFPQYILGFGSNPHLAEFYGEEAFSGLSFFSGHPFLSRVFGHRSAFGTEPYMDLRLSSGYAYEDWHFNATAYARDVALHVAPATVLYYRQRAASLLKSAHAVSIGQIPPTPFFEPEIFGRICARDYARFKREEPKPTSAQEVREKFLSSSACVNASIAANQIDRAVDISLVEHVPAFSNLELNQDLGAYYYELAGLLKGRRFTDVVLLPFLTTGGAEKYILNVLNALAQLDPEREFLVLCGQGGVRSAWLDRLPENSLFLDLFHRCPRLDAAALETLTLRVIQSTAPNANIHLKPSEYAVGFFSRYGRLLPGNKRIFYRFSDQVFSVQGEHVTRGWSFNFISENLDNLDLIIADHEKICDEDRRRIGIDEWKWTPLYTRCDPIASLDDGSLPHREKTHRLLWASRLDPEKRPELLASLAAELSRLLPEVTIDVYGRSVYGTYTRQLEELPNVRLCGEYSDFGSLQHDKYDAFLYTSAYDGLPNVVLEALSAGLPVIAPDVGGLSEVVVTGRTGILIDNDPDDGALVERYVQAIALLPNLDVAAIGRQAVELVEDRHAHAPFLERVRTIFGPAQ